MNVGEWGITYNLNQNFDISGFTILSLVITRPDGTTITRTNPQVSVGAAPLVTSDDGTYATNQYAIYVFAVGDLTLPGTYTSRLSYTDATKHLVGDVVSFDVSL
jgi:hypothetical protein